MLVRGCIRRSCNREVILARRSRMGAVPTTVREAGRCPMLGVNTSCGCCGYAVTLAQYDHVFFLEVLLRSLVCDDSEEGIENASTVRGPPGGGRVVRVSFFVASWGHV